MKVRYKILVLLLFLLTPVVTLAQQDDSDPQQLKQGLLISEVMTGGAESASDEFLELFNPSDELIDLSMWSIEYKSASGTDWIVRSNLVGTIQPRGYYLISSYSSPEEANLVKTLGLASGGGHLRVVGEFNDDLTRRVTDLIGWGTADSPEDSSALAPEAGFSLKRRFNEDGMMIDTNINSDDFIISSEPSPTSTPPPDIIMNTDSANENSSTNDDSSQLQQEDTKTTTDQETSALKTYPKIQITEIFVDPEMPQLDANDEFVELYNPNDISVNLESYTIETGNNLTYSYVLPAIILEPYSYEAFYARGTSLALANSGGRARVSDPNGRIVDETPFYPKARTGESYALFNGSWVWTDTPTPGAANKLLQPIYALSTSGPKSNTTSNAGSVKSSSSSNNTSNERIVYKDPEPLVNPNVDNSVVAGVGALAILYAGYEYRYDIGNRFHQLQRYIKSRKANRQKT